MANPYSFGSRSPETKALQLVLTGHSPPFDTKGTDGIFGKDTRDAVQAAQEFYGLAPADGVVRTPLLVELGIVAPQTSNPITDFFTGLALKALLSQLKGIPIVNILTGYKTYIAGVAMILTGIVDFTGTLVPGSEGFSPLQWVFAGAFAIFGRSALNTVALQIAKLFGINVDTLPKL